MKIIFLLFLTTLLLHSKNTTQLLSINKTPNNPTLIDYDINNFSMPLIINNYPFTTIKVSIKEDNVSILYKDIYKILDLTTIKYTKNSDKLNILVPLNKLQQYKIQSKFDNQTLKIYIKIPPEKLKVHIINFKKKKIC